MRKKRRKFMSKTMRRILSGMMLMVLMLTSTSISSVYAATLQDQLPIIAYTLNGKVDTYSSVNGSKTGWVASSDQCKILAVYDSGWVKISYPKDSGGTKTAYAKTSDFFSNTSWNVGKMTIGQRMTVYRRADLSQSLGTMYASDEVVIIGNNGRNTQIIMPVSGGYKMGWISGVYENDAKLQEVRIADGYYQIKASADENYVIDIWCCSLDDGANVLLYHNLWQSNQAFLIRHQENGYYTIAAIHSGKLLDVEGNQMHSGANVIQCQSNGGDNQLWKIYKTPDGYYSFQSKSSGKFLDISGGNVCDDSNIQVYDCNHSDAQKFALGSVLVDGKGYEGSTNQSNTINLNVPDYKQYDSRWAGDYIGTRTMKQRGCLIVSLAMKASYQTGTIYPDAMKGKLSFSNNDIYWSSVSNLGYSYTKVYGCKITQSIMQTIYQKLSEGKPVIIGGTNSSNGMHWILIKGYQGTSTSTFNASDFIINDPNSTKTTLQQFLNSYPYVERLIY